MKLPTILRLWTPLCAVFIFYACQKETSVVNTEPKEASTRSSGVVTDDPGEVAKVPTIMSESFHSLGIPAGAPRGSGSRKDTDDDGIADVKDSCPRDKETINGYLDTDGCPDTAPPTSADADGDGITDSADTCPTQPETSNGYQDNDGCPDTEPDTDNDGIRDANDSCPTEAETANGYMDEDGCPDVPPVVLPPVTTPASFFLKMPPVQNREAKEVAFHLLQPMRQGQLNNCTDPAHWTIAMQQIYLVLNLFTIKLKPAIAVPVLA